MTTYAISGIQLSVSSGSFDCSSQAESFTFTATVQTNATPGGFLLQGTFEGLGPEGPIGSGHYMIYTVAPNTTVTVVTDALDLGIGNANGHYSMQFSGRVYSVANGAIAYSNQVAVTKSC
jgi:hypothetical protein